MISDETIRRWNERATALEKAYPIEGDPRRDPDFRGLSAEARTALLLSAILTELQRQRPAPFRYMGPG